uniref:Uncharacterized protein n=1 Tax=Ananas comosus var. bracteatus TaxID=296719 RepID=A0A6V7NP46_ANACO|nr:unnamed protein product [Ananas comosus var. bracteatus]
MMPITRSQLAGADNAANLEEVETSATSGSGEVRELRSQLATLTDLMAQQAAAAQQQADTARRQEARMKRLEDLLLQQAAASRETQAPTPPAPVWTSRRERCPCAQFVACCARGSALGGGFGGATCSGTPIGAIFPVLVEGAERDRLMERLNEFKRCGPGSSTARRSTTGS